MRTIGAAGSGREELTAEDKGRVEQFLFLLVHLPRMKGEVEQK